MRKKMSFEWTQNALVNFDIAVQFFLHDIHTMVFQIFLQQHLVMDKKDLCSYYKDKARTRFWPYLSSIFFMKNPQAGNQLC